MTRRKMIVTTFVALLLFRGSSPLVRVGKVYGMILTMSQDSVSYIRMLPFFSLNVESWRCGWSNHLPVRGEYECALCAKVSSDVVGHRKHRLLYLLPLFLLLQLQPGKLHPTGLMDHLTKVVMM